MKRLPTKEEFEALLELQEKWDEDRKGLVIKASNGNKLFFPALGRRNGSDVYHVGVYGNHWSSTSAKEKLAWYFYFNFYVPCMGINYCDSGLAVRLVSDEPCDGFVDMGTGIYWATENYKQGDEEYFTWHEAMALKFDELPTADSTPCASLSHPIDWEQRRYEIAKDALCGLLANLNFVGTTSQAEMAVKYADELIEQLKTKQQ